MEAVCLGPHTRNHCSTYRMHMAQTDQIESAGLGEATGMLQTAGKSQETRVIMPASLRHIRRALSECDAAASTSHICPQPANRSAAVMLHSPLHSLHQHVCCRGKSRTRKAAAPAESASDAESGADKEAPPAKKKARKGAAAAEAASAKSARASKAATKEGADAMDADDSAPPAADAATDAATVVCCQARCCASGRNSRSRSSPWLMLHRARARRLMQRRVERPTSCCAARCL